MSDEIPYTRDLCKQMKLCNAEILPVVANKYMPAGWPDRYVVHSYWIGWIEFKGTNTKVRPIQKIRLRFIRERHPCAAYVVREGNTIEDEEGNVLATFDGTGLGLIKKLREMRDA